MKPRTSRDRAAPERALVPVDPPPETDETLIPGYHRCRVAADPIAVGQLVYLLSVEEGKAHFLRGEKSWRMPAASFAASFVFDPEGHVHRALEMGTLMSEVGALQAEYAQERAVLAGFNPHVDAAGDPSGLALVPAGDDLALAPDSPLATKRTVALMRNQAAKLRGELERRQSEIKAFAEEQALILRAQMGELQEVLARAEEAVWTINLYLGQNEEIARLAEGAPADADTPITIRQLVLYMDEECAVAAEEGGIDARSIESFDEWLTEDPAHLAQVLPEAKGMVALQPRRTMREYGDVWANKALNEANKKTYFLLRNGANLYRMWTDFEVGERLIPKTDEFLAYFVERERDWTTGKDRISQMTPGSDAFMKAEKRAAAQQRHYMRAALILQGLIDRTTIFRPAKPAWGKINVADQASYVPGGPLAVVLDADLMLSDGRERFADWFVRINGQLALGMRIIGTFNSWEHGLRQYVGERDRHDNSRISPHGAEYPSDRALYTIEERRNGRLDESGEPGFAFFYHRSDMRWDLDEGEVAYAKRAVCLVYPYDRFILNFDAATEDEMAFYLTSRLDRDQYTYLFPPLKRALKLKAAERAAEVPFAALLAGQIVKAYGQRPDGPDFAEASAAVPELIRWWKFKNRTHRALTEDDAKALRMIVAEYGLRAEAAADRAQLAARGDAAALVNMVRAAEPEVMLIAHKAGNEYVALVPANAEDTFVHEQTWTLKGRKETREWRTVGTRQERWQLLYHSARWNRWPLGAVAAEHLSDPERAALVEAGWQTLREQRAWFEARQRGAGRRINGRWTPSAPLRTDLVPLVPMAATVALPRPDRSGRNAPVNVRPAPPAAGVIELYYDDGPFGPDGQRTPLPETLLISSEVRSPALGRTRIRWKRDAERRVVVEQLDNVQLAYGGTPWERDFQDRPYSGQLLWRDPAAIDVFQARAAEVQAVRERTLGLGHQVSAALEDLHRQYATEVEEEAKRKFMVDFFGDPDLWEGHKKGLKLASQLPDPGPVRTALSYLVERGVSIEGLSIGELITAAIAAGASSSLSVSDEVRELRVGAGKSGKGRKD